MAASVVSLLIALALYFGDFLPGILEQSPELLPLMGIGVSLAWLILIPLLVGVPSVALQRAETGATPQVIALLRRHPVWRWALFGWGIFPILSVSLAFVPNEPIYPCIWLVGFGVNVDLMRRYVCIVMELLQPQLAIEQMVHVARQAVNREDDREFFLWLDTISDTAARATRRVQPSVARLALQSTYQALEAYVASLVHRERRLVGKSEDTTDQLRLVLYFTFERMRLIYSQAMRRNTVPVANEVISTLSQITLLVGRSNFMLAGLVMPEFGEYARSAFVRGRREQVVKVSCALTVVAKALIQEENVQHSDVKDFYINLIAHLETISQETFRQDKTSSISVLTQPFRDLQEIFESETFDGRNDVAMIRNSLKRVLEDFAALEQVMTQLEITGEGDSAEDMGLPEEGIAESTSEGEEMELAEMAGLADIEGIDDLDAMRKRLQEVVEAEKEEEGEQGEKED